MRGATILAPHVAKYHWNLGELLRRLHDMGVTVLLAEQNMNFCLGIASHASIIDKGQIVFRDTIHNIKLNESVKSRYLAL